MHCNFFILTPKLNEFQRIKYLSKKTLATAWMKLEVIMLSEISQLVNDKFHMMSPIRGT